MQTMYLSATAAQTQLTKAFDHVEKGGKVVFTKYGKKVGTLTPEPKKQSRRGFRFSSRDMAQLEKLAFDGPKINSTALIRKMRDEE